MPSDPLVHLDTHLFQLLAKSKISANSKKLIRRCTKDNESISPVSFLVNLAEQPVTVPDRSEF